MSPMCSDIGEMVLFSNSSIFQQAPDEESGNAEEQAYLNLVKFVIEQGQSRGDRTGTGTLSLFAPPQLRFKIDEFFPLLTSKRTFFRGVAEELFWFLKGSVHIKKLQEKNIKIWNGNGSREFLDSRNLCSYENGELGPVYGFQWRHFGAKYLGPNHDYTGQGVDQIKEIIDTIKNNPTDRRMILTAWNPADLNKMALPPCHLMCQFYVTLNDNGKNYLSCQMYQRSCDLGLGVPFNIASYALLVYLIAHCTDTIPYEFIHCMGDAHVYSNHVEPLKEQLKRIPRPFPKLKINNSSRDIDELSFKDLEIIDYKPHGRIDMQMAV
eukprot:NODE_36_length_31474_cov_0.342438.p9 type:complete len:323 gc:universal NODE_36_length_31474_cov_0.342438:20378-19410(-)